MKKTELKPFLDMAEEILEEYARFYSEMDKKSLAKYIRNKFEELLINNHKSNNSEVISNSKENQIEEMAECCPYFWNGACTVDAAKPTDCDLMCEMFGFMTSLVNAGYRKQSEGEWIEHEDAWCGNYYTCSVCKCDWTTIDGTPQENNMRYCPECGAKMKGGAE